MNENIRLKVMLPLASGLLLLLIIFAFAIYYFQAEHIQNDVFSQMNNVPKMFQQELHQDTELLSGLLDFIEKDDNLRQAWLTRDRQQLLEKALPVFKHIRSQYRVTHFYFHGIDRVNFLRVHSPDRFGDLIDRFTMIGAATTGKTVHGIELGPLGTFTLRVVRPWLIDGELVGYLELGEEIEHVMKRLQKSLGLDFLLLIDKKYINQEKWLNGLQVMNRHENWEDYEQTAVIYRTIDTPVEDIRHALSQKHAGNKDVTSSFAFKGQHFHCGFIPLIDAGDQNVGDIVTFYNTTGQKKTLSKFVQKIFWISSLLGLALLGFFWSYLGRIEGQLNVARYQRVVVQQKLEATNIQLQSSEEKYRSIIENMQDVFYRTDVQGKLTLISPSGAKLLGYDSSEEILGKNVTVLYANSDDRRGFLESFQESGRQITNYELEFKRKDGSTLPVIVSGAQYLDEEGKPGGVEGTFSDITERKQLEGELLHSQKMESVGQLAAGIAHEINTPAQFLGTNIDFLDESFQDVENLIKEYQGFVQTVKNGSAKPELLTSLKESVEEFDWEYLSEEIPLSIKQSREGIERISTIVRAMKEFSHPGSKEKAPVNINDIINTTVIVATNEWKYVATIESDLASDLPSIICLADEMGQVFLNILVNAAHAIADALGDNPDGKKGKIAISSRLDGQWLEVCVKDNGKGMPDSVKEHIFDPFFTTKEVGKGTGQGLAIAHSVVIDKHKGRLICESEEGVGTTFIIKLPVSA